MTPKEIAKAFRDAATKLESDPESWSDDDVVSVGTAARMANRYQLGLDAKRSGKMSREAFDAMGAKEQNEFMKKGGQLVNV